MIPSPTFAALDPAFWAHVKLVSERLGYSDRALAGVTKTLKRHSAADIESCLGKAGLDTAHLFTGTIPTELADLLSRYIAYRADVLETHVHPNLMNREEARLEFEKLRGELNPHCSLPLNKQKGEKRHHAYLTGIVNMLTEQALGSRTFVDSPRGLTIATKDKRPLRTFSRWMDGAYPDLVDPHAVWEVKEYYGTKTFGSRVADGVYETMLDGHEFRELAEHESRRIRHYLIVDDRFTWWDCGRSYLCRIVDMLHVGLVDEVLFGREVISRWPEIVRTWP